MILAINKNRTLKNVLVFVYVALHGGKFMTRDELNNFWNARDVKIWVVTLFGIGKNIYRTDTKYVKARTEKKALICAKNNSIYFYNKRCTGTARYADPVSDLHCVQALKHNDVVNESRQ